LNERLEKEHGIIKDSKKEKVVELLKPNAILMKQPSTTQKM
jgi:hypothetical protein